MSLREEFAKLYQVHVYKTFAVGGVLQDPDGMFNPHGIARKTDYYHNPEYPDVKGVDPVSSQVLYTYPTQPTQSALDQQIPSYLVASTVPREVGMSFVNAGYLKDRPHAFADIWEFLPSSKGGKASSVLRDLSVIV